jgi:hypothetical protein
MLFHSRRFGADAILDQADSIFQPVPFVNLFDEGAGERLTLEAKINSPTGGAGFDFAAVAIPRLGRFLSIAAGAGLLLTDMGIARGAGQPAGSQHGWGDDGHFHFFKRTSRHG